MFKTKRSITKPDWYHHGATTRMYQLRDRRIAKYLLDRYYVCNQFYQLEMERKKMELRSFKELNCLYMYNIS